MVVLAGRAVRVGLIALLALTVTAIGAGIYVLSVSLGEHVTFRRGDAAYYIIATSKTVRAFPRFSASARAADFTYVARDGPAPGQITMTYSSTAGVADLDRKHRAYCESRNYTSVPEDDLFLASRLGCDASDYRIEVFLRPRENGTSVTVDFVER